MKKIWWQEKGNLTCYRVEVAIFKKDYRKSEDNLDITLFFYFANGVTC